MKLILKCTSPAFSPDDIAWAFVTVDAPLLEQALTRRRLFLQSQAQDDQFYEMYVWDTTPDFFPSTPTRTPTSPLMKTSASKTPYVTMPSSRSTGPGPISIASGTRLSSPTLICAPSSALACASTRMASPGPATRNTWMWTSEPALSPGSFSKAGDCLDRRVIVANRISSPDPPHPNVGFFFPSEHSQRLQSQRVHEKDS